MRQLPVNVVQPLPQYAGNRRAFPLAHAKEIAERLLEKVHHHIIQRVFAVAFAHQHAGQRQHVAPGRLTEGIATVGGGECLQPLRKRRTIQPLCARIGKRLHENPHFHLAALHRCLQTLANAAFQMAQGIHHLHLYFEETVVD